MLGFNVICTPRDVCYLLTLCLLADAEGTDACLSIYNRMRVWHGDLQPQDTSQHDRGHDRCDHCFLWRDQLCSHRRPTAIGLCGNRVDKTHAHPDSATKEGVEPESCDDHVLHCSSLLPLPQRPICSGMVSSIPFLFMSCMSSHTSFGAACKSWD